MPNSIPVAIQDVVRILTSTSADSRCDLMTAQAEAWILREGTVPAEEAQRLCNEWTRAPGLGHPTGLMSPRALAVLNLPDAQKTGTNK